MRKCYFIIVHQARKKPDQSGLGFGIHHSPSSNFALSCGIKNFGKSLLAARPRGRKRVIWPPLSFGVGMSGGGGRLNSRRRKSWKLLPALRPTNLGWGARVKRERESRRNCGTWRKTGAKQKMRRMGRVVENHDCSVCRRKKRTAEFHQIGVQS